MQDMQDRRREPRRPASGNLTLIPSDGPRFAANLLDTSASGFRAEYSQPAIRSGTELTVESGSETYQVRVAWTMTVAGKSQSGFYRV
jgi:hypothetical protein